MKKLILLFFVSFSIVGLQAQDFNKAGLDSLLDVLEKNDQFMGSLAVSHKGQTLYARAVGNADVATKTEANSSTKYRVGSITKVFTSTLVFMAQEEGKLKIEDKLSVYFPDFPKGDEITLSNLLNHHSGIYNFTNDSKYLEWSTMRYSREELMEKIKANEFAFEPGTKGEYSNSNYVLLTFILEDVYGKSYTDLVYKKIAKPLGLKNTYVGDVIDPEKNEAYSYEYTGEWEKSIETDMSVPLGAGAIVSTPSDLNTFSYALFTGELLSEASLKSMKEIQDNFGRGLFTFPYFDKTAYGHTGGIDAFSSMFGCITADGLSVALISNGNRFSNNKIMIGALAAFYNDPLDIPEFNNVEYTDSELESFAGQYYSDEIPLPIEVTKKNKELFAQAQGQSAFPLTPIRENVFGFDQAGLVMEFNPDEDSFVLKQGGQAFNYKKK